MGRDSTRDRISCFIIGVLSTITLLALTGAVGAPSHGKYQMEMVVRNNITNIYVMDTTTGQVKWVNKMNLPFTEMKGD
jgi:hypothetical protein